jgi:hypothetical protein
VFRGIVTSVPAGNPAGVVDSDSARGDGESVR